MPIRFNNLSTREILFFVSSSINPNRLGKTFPMLPGGYFIASQHESGFIRNWREKDDIPFSHGEHDAWVGKQDGKLSVTNLAKPTNREVKLITRGITADGVHVQFIRTAPKTKETF